MVDAASAAAHIYPAPRLYVVKSLARSKLRGMTRSQHRDMMDLEAGCGVRRIRCNAASKRKSYSLAKYPNSYCAVGLKSLVLLVTLLSAKNLRSCYNIRTLPKNASAKLEQYEHYMSQ